MLKVKILIYSVEESIIKWMPCCYVVTAVYNYCVILNSISPCTHLLQSKTIKYCMIFWSVVYPVLEYMFPPPFMMIAYIVISDRSRGLQSQKPRTVVCARGKGSPTDHRPTQNSLLGLGCDRTTSMATEWGGWKWNGDLTAFRRLTGPGPGETNGERASGATTKILSCWQVGYHDKYSYTGKRELVQADGG